MESDVITVSSIAPLLMNIMDNPETSHCKLLKLKEQLSSAPNFVVQQTQKYIIGALNAIISKTKKSLDYKTKSAITLLLEVIFKKSVVEELKVFLFAYKYLLDQVYDQHQPNCVSTIAEELKLEIMHAMISLIRALTWSVLEQLYNKENGLVLCQMIYVALEMAKSEQYRTLRVACIECIMCISQVDDSSDFTDLELRCRIADVFILFLPGITSSLAKIALEDEKQGHAISMLAIKAWGRIVTLQMQNYNAADEPIIPDFQEILKVESASSSHKKWKTPTEVKQYLDNAKRSLSWYRDTDEKLQSIMSSFSQLTHHSHIKVRKHLLQTCSLLVEFCYGTIPKTTGSAINNLIILSEDDDNEVSESAKDILRNLSNKLSENNFTNLFQILEENLYSAVMALPRIFNRLDENEQLSAINSIVGYLKVFGNNELLHILRLPSHLNHLIQGLIHISKIESKDVRLHNEYVFEVLAREDNHRTPWKSFRYFRNGVIELKIQKTCALLTMCDSLDIASDLLMEIYINLEDRKEATLLLNEMLFGLQGVEVDTDYLCIINSVLDLYMEPAYWNIPLKVASDLVLSEVQDNIVQICLQLEGIGKIALVLKEEFKQKMLKTLYPIFEYAGSDHSLIRATATSTIENISTACGYISIHSLINKNLDYLTYHILRKLRKRDETEHALKALATVLKYGDINMLHFFIGDLLHSCDTFFQEHNADTYLHVFQIVIKSLKKWLTIEIKIEPIKSKQQKELEHESFRIANMPSEDFEISENEDGVFDNELIGDEKPPPTHIKLIEDLLQRCVHFLPSKKRSLKILVIDIFQNGLEILRDWDNNMLPLVHQIWSPLIDRFKERDDYVLISYSFQLLMVLARLSKDFIRSRTAKDVLPLIREILSKLVKASHLQDKGSAYRYTQAYKLQLFVLQHLGRVLIDLDLSDAHIIETMENVFPYLSNKQPIPLQEATLSFYSDLIQFDTNLVKLKLEDQLKAVATPEKIDYLRNISRLIELCET